MTLSRQPFAEHLSGLVWDQGDHVMIAAPTKSGKTTLASRLVARRSHVITFATKPRDTTLDTEFKGWDIVENERQIKPYMNRVIVRVPDSKTMFQVKAQQRAVFPEIFDFVYRNGGWCVLIDETMYMSDPKYANCGSQIEMMHYHGRSNGISMVTLSQRPAFIPKIIYSSAAHAYIARTRDSGDLRRLADLGNVVPKELAADISTLPTRYDFVYTPSLGEGIPAVLNTRK